MIGTVGFNKRFQTLCLLFGTFLITFGFESGGCRLCFGWRCRCRFEMGEVGRHTGNTHFMFGFGGGSFFGFDGIVLFGTGRFLVVGICLGTSAFGWWKVFDGWIGHEGGSDVGEHHHDGWTGAGGGHLALGCHFTSATAVTHLWPV